jgi:hypothetical protein
LSTIGAARNLNELGYTYNVKLANWAGLVSLRINVNNVPYMK